MKLKQALLPLAALSLAASLATPLATLADDDAAYSANVVGVIKYEVPANGGLNCIALPLNPIGTNEWVFGDTSLATQLANGSTVYFWDSTGWASASKSVRTGKWQPATALNHVFLPGEAFFIQGPDDAVATTISLLGELPLESNLTYAVTGSQNLDTRSVTRYPVATVFGTSELANSLPNGSTVYFWDNGWASVSKSVRTGNWQPATALQRSIAVGEGVFVQAEGDAPFVVTNAIPFNLQ